MVLMVILACLSMMSHYNVGRFLVLRLLHSDIVEELGRRVNRGMMIDEQELLASPLCCKDYSKQKLLSYSDRYMI